MNKEDAQTQLFPDRDIKWEPCTIQDEDTGQLYWGDTDTPIEAIWEAHEVCSYIRSKMNSNEDGEILVPLLEALGKKVIVRDGEYIILEEPNEE